jgi:hypothetical protein
LFKSQLLVPDNPAIIVANRSLAMQDDGVAAGITPAAVAN